MGIDSNLDEEQEIQEVQYSFPYHYIPETDYETQFSQTKHWSWGYQYLGGILIVLDQLEKLKFDSIIDVGCGDGRFLHELNKQYPEVNKLGIDYSQRAIDMANAMNPDITYSCLDITSENVDKKSKIVSLIEVLEHIPPTELEEFIEETVSLVSEDGYVIITVPHENKSVQKKHYQHFNREKLTHLLDRHFRTLEFIPFDQQSRILNYVQNLLGGRGSHYIITNETIKSVFWTIYTSHYLYSSESDCGRIAVVAKK